MNFTHLSVRSDMSGTSRSSIQDYVGSARVEDYVKEAKELGQSSIAMTDLGTMRNVYSLKTACHKYGVKPIYGVEVYVCLDHTKKNVSPEQAKEINKNLPPSKWREAVDSYAIEHGYMRQERDLSTLTLWAMSDEGLKNLFRLTSKSWIDGFFYKPRVDVAMLQEFSCGVACGTGGPNSWIHKPHLAGRRKESIERFKELSEIYQDRLVIEIRPHRLLEQEKSNSFAVELKTLAPKAWVIPTQNAHYVKKGELDAQKMLCSIGSKGSELSSSGLEIDSYWLRSSQEMAKALLECGFVDSSIDAQELCESSVTFADCCSAEFETDPFAMVMPNIDTGENSHVQQLKMLCLASSRWEEVSKDSQSKYNERLNSELEILGKPVAEGSEKTFASYIVYVNEVVSMCRDLGITLGPGRGSAAGSIVNWLLGITDVDPVKHDLMFSRFISSNRIGPPDVDIDVDPSERLVLFDAMKQRWGGDCVAQISTFGKLKGRVVVADVCRALGISIPESVAVTKLISQKSDHDDGALEAVKEAFIGTDEVPAIQDCVRFSEKYPEVVPYAMALEGKMRNLGVHPAGIVCSPVPLFELVPMETRKSKEGDERLVVTAFDMQGVEQSGLLKIDMLGLITIGVISEALDAINSGGDELNLTMSNIPLDDEKTLKAFEDRDFVGVFQFDSASAKKLCKGVVFPSFGTISDMTALNRPGPLDSGMADEYIQRMHDPSSIKVDYCEKVSKITEETLGIMIYQEQVMRVVGEVGLHDNPDTMRKIIGKKLMDKMEAERPGFLAGAKKSSPEMSEEVANKLFDDIATFGRYSFGKSHSISYAKIGYICQYLKVHYPLEFFWSMMLSASENGKNDKLKTYAKEAKSRGIKVLSPDISKSGFRLGIDRERNAAIGALTDIKKVGDKAAQSIVANQPFETLDGFMESIDKRLVNKGCIVALAQAGAMDELLPNTKLFVDNAEFLFKESKLKRFKGWETTLKEFDGSDYTLDEKMFWASEVNPMALENPYTSMLQKMPLEVRSFESKTFLEDEDGEQLWISGTLRGIKIYQDTGYGDKPISDVEKEHESYGKEYAVGSIEADSGKAVKIKFPAHIYETFKDEIDDDVAIVASVKVDSQWQTFRANFALSLKKLKLEKKSYSLLQRAVTSHPALSLKNATESTMERAKKDMKAMKGLLHRGSFDALPVIGMVTSIRTKLAGKHLKEMAWIGIISPDGEFTEITMFSGDWLGGSSYGGKGLKTKRKGAFGVGSIVRIDVISNEFNGRFGCQYSGGVVEVLS